MDDGRHDALVFETLMREHPRSTLAKISPALLMAYDDVLVLLVSVLRNESTLSNNFRILAAPCPRRHTYHALFWQKAESDRREVVSLHVLRPLRPLLFRKR